MYDNIKSTLEKFLGGFSGGVKFETPLTPEDFSNWIGYDIKADWEKTTNWAENEYGTQDFRFNIQNEETNTVLSVLLEVQNDMIVSVEGVDEY